MSYAQPAVVESHSFWSRALGVRAFSLEEWRAQRHIGRNRMVRRLALAALLYPPIMMATQALVLVAAGLAPGVILTAAYLAWAVPIMLAFPPAVYLIARAVWDANEARYRRERAKLGRRPTPLMNETVAE